MAKGLEMISALVIKNMQRQAASIDQLLANIGSEQARWKPDPEMWSLLEVAHHLLDEEKFDFRARLDVILHHSDQKWEKIDPAGWVTKRAYNEADLGMVLAEFLEEREKSLAWLRGLANPNWDIVYKAPFGDIQAGDMLTAWAGHDLLHIRQLTELHWAHLGEQALPYITRYAGEWEV